MKQIKKSDGFVEEKLIIIPRNLVDKYSLNPLNSPIYITGIGYFPNAKYHYREREDGCEENILIYCINGEGFFKNGDNIRIVKKYDVIVIPKKNQHIYGSSIEKPWSILWVHFMGYNSKHYLSRLNIDNYIISCKFEKIMKIKLLFEEIFNVLEKGLTSDNLVYISQVFSYILASTFYNVVENDGMKKCFNTQIEKSINFMTQNLAESLTLHDLAENVNLSNSHYSYIFKKIIGIAPIDYFIKLKIQKACYFLDVTDLKINEVARKVGFTDPYYFSRCFNKIMLSSPSDYRKLKKG